MPADPILLECAGCGDDFLAQIPPLCPRCATVLPCGHLYADTVEDATGNPVCARCLEEVPYVR